MEIKNSLNSKLQYIKINHKNKFEDLDEAEYYKELMNLANSMHFGEQNLGIEINKFFQYILPENKEGDLLKVNIAISYKSKKNKKYEQECINDIMNMKERNNLILTKDFSEKISTIIKAIFRKIKKKSAIKTFSELVTKAKECLYQGGNIIKKYMVEKKVREEMYINDDLSIISNNSNNNINSNINIKDFNNSTKDISKLIKTFKEQTRLEFEFKEFKEDKKELLPVEMRLLIKKFTTIKKIQLTLNDNDFDFKNSSKKNIELNPNDIQNNILVLFNVDWLFPNLLELEVDLSNETLLKEQIYIQSKNLEILSDLLNKDTKLTAHHSGIYKNIIFNPYQLSNFCSSSVLKEDDYLYVQQNINYKNKLSFYKNFGKEIKNKATALNEFIVNKKSILEMIIIYGYFISKMESIHMCDFVLPMNLEEEIILMLKANKIYLTDFHFLSFFTGSQIFHFTINFNSLDCQSFERVLNFVNQNTSMKICRINFFQPEEYFKPEILYKLLQNSNSNYKKFNIFSYDDSNYYIYDLKVNEDIDDYLLRKLAEYFQRNITNFFYLLTIRININELSLIFDMPDILLKNDIYNIIIMKFLINLFIFIDSNKNNIDTLSLQAERFIFDSRKHILNNIFEKLNLFNNSNNKIKKLTYQVTFYRIINIYRLVPYNIEQLSLGSFDKQTFEVFVNYITSSDFAIHSSLTKLQINLNNCLMNYDEFKDNLGLLLTEYPKTLVEINIYSFLIISYDNLRKLLLKTNYNTLENIFFQFNIKSLKDKQYKNKLKNRINENNILIESNFLNLFYVIRKKKDTNKIISIIKTLSHKINKNFSNYIIYSNIEKFISKNEKKVNIIQFK